MSTLTKILVVLFVVLAIFASVVFLREAVTPGNYRLAYDGQLQRANEAAAQQQAAQQQLSTLQAAYDKLLGDSKKALETAQASQLALMAVRDGLLADKANLTAKVETQTAIAASQEATLKKFADMLQLVQEQLAAATKLNVGQNEQLRQQEQALSELRVSIDLSQAQNRMYKEQIAGLTERVKELETTLARTPTPPTTATPVAPKPAGKIEGSVTAVRGGGVQVNVGSADGVTQGMQFTIYRGSEFVAEVSISDVFPNSSAGVLKDIRTAPQQGDKVTTSLR